jgi:hypothetical protein
MKAVRRRFNHSKVVLLASGEVIGSAFCGKSVDVRMRNGESRPFEFGGFVSHADAENVQRVKIRDIEAWTEDVAGMGGWQLTGTAFDGHVVGVYIGGMVMIVEGPNGGPIIIA